jgi:signal transduction histidine kinase
VRPDSTGGAKDKSVGLARLARFPPPYMRPRIFPVILTLLTTVLMVGTANRIITEFRTTRLHAQVEMAEAFLTHFLEPYARAQLSSSAASGPKLEALEAALARHLGTKPMIAAQIWLPEGGLLYSSTGGLHAADHDSSDLTEALLGEKVIQVETIEDGDEIGPIALPYVEVYLPITDSVASRPIAVGEVYVDASALIEDSARFERTVWLSLGSALVAMIGMLALSARQSEVLRARLEAEHELVSQNDALRREAESARFASAEANEQTLNYIGAEIHDGPLQLLGLAALLGAKAPSPDTSSDATAPGLVQQAVAELRRISAGLILPEIEELTTLQTVELAVSRHRSLTGRSVDLTIDGPATLPGLDVPRRIGLYRVIQEGLANATRHGGEGPVSISLAVDGAVLMVTIGSRQRVDGMGQEDGSKQKLGLQGMRRRLATFNGSVEFELREDRALLVVALPSSSAAQSGTIASETR